jgi:hypothetical protein
MFVENIIANAYAGDESTPVFVADSDDQTLAQVLNISAGDVLQETPDNLPPPTFEADKVQGNY